MEESSESLLRTESNQDGGISDGEIVAVPQEAHLSPSTVEEREDLGASNTPSQNDSSSVIGEISAIRDFFVAAFSDGYYGVSRILFTLK